MIELFIYSIAAFGFAYCAGHSVISRGLRSWIIGKYDYGLRFWFVTLIECPACLGFWTGAIIGGAIDGGWGIAIGALYTAGSNYILSKLTRLID